MEPPMRIFGERLNWESTRTMLVWLGLDYGLPLSRADHRPRVRVVTREVDQKMKMKTEEWDNRGGQVKNFGHYVLICGYDAGADMFEIRDPASSKYLRRRTRTSISLSCNFWWMSILTPVTHEIFPPSFAMICPSCCFICLAYITYSLCIVSTTRES